MKNNRKSLRVLLGILVVALNSMPQSASAYNCYSDCGNAAKTSYACPTFRNPRRRCEGKNPVIFGACETAKEADCKVLAPMEDAILDKMAAEVASSPEVEHQADGWSKTTCPVAGGAIILAVADGYSTPICAALSAAGGVGGATCVAFVLASGAAITDITCNQLCTDHQLKDCK